LYKDFQLFPKRNLSPTFFLYFLENFTAIKAIRIIFGRLLYLIVRLFQLIYLNLMCQDGIILQDYNNLVLYFQ
jgi:hypothetical protein